MKNRKGRLLVVDTDPEICRLVDDVFSDCGFDVEQAGSATDARRALRTGAFRVVVTEYVLPDERGASTAEHAARLGAFVIMITGHPEAIQALEALPYPRLTKPFRLDRLVELALKGVG
jgi:DNA-binding NtrC family response regulator